MISRFLVFKESLRLETGPRIFFVEWLCSGCDRWLFLSCPSQCVTLENGAQIPRARCDVMSGCAGLSVEATTTASWGGFHTFVLVVLLHLFIELRG